MSKSARNPKSKDRKCDKGFQHNERRKRNCEFCGAEMPQTKRKLMLIEKIKRFLCT